MKSIACEDLSVEAYRKALLSEEVNFVFTRRSTPDIYQKVKDTINSQNKLRLQTWLVNEPIEILGPRLRKDLKEFGFEKEVISWISDDVLSLVKIFVDLTSENQPFVSLRSIDGRYFDNQSRSVSKDWHVDTAVLTLTCTYSGRGTEWVVDDSSVRKNFETEKMPELNFSLADLQIEEMSLFEVGVLKGEIRNPEDNHSKKFIKNFLNDDEIEPFNMNGGLLHRGPNYFENDDRRLLLTVSTMRIPEWLR